MAEFWENAKNWTGKQAERARDGVISKTPRSQIRRPRNTFQPREQLIRRIAKRTNSLLKDVNDKLHQLHELAVAIEHEIEEFEEVKKEEHKGHLDKIDKVLEDGNSDEWRNTGQTGIDNYRKKRDEMVEEYDKIAREMDKAGKKVEGEDSGEERIIRREIHKVKKEYEKLQAFLGLLERYRRNPQANSVDELIDEIKDIIKIHKQESRYDSRIKRWDKKKTKDTQKWESYLEKRNELLNGLSLST